MELRLHRNEANVYELIYNDIVLVEASSLSQAIEQGRNYAKKFSKKLLISQSAVADWYIGFNKESAPQVFFDPHFMVKAQIEDQTSSPYAFVEGPFLSPEDAVEAAFKISGRKAVIQKPEVE